MTKQTTLSRRSLLAGAATTAVGVGLAAAGNAGAALKPQAAPRQGRTRGQLPDR